jgi:hypothetical protein
MVAAMKNKLTTTKPLPATEFGIIPSDRQRTFFRVENWNGRFLADFGTEREAKQFAIADARAKGARYDHKVSTVHLRGA